MNAMLQQDPFGGDFFSPDFSFAFPGHSQKFQAESQQNPRFIHPETPPSLVLFLVLSVHGPMRRFNKTKPAASVKEVKPLEPLSR